MNANLQKYLKYKSKYLDLKNELEGGGDFWNRITDPENFRLIKKKNLPKLKKEERNKQYESVKREQISRLQKLLELQKVSMNKIKLTFIRYVILNKVNERDYLPKKEKIIEQINIIMKNVSNYLQRYNQLIQEIEKEQDQDQDRLPLRQAHQWVGGAYKTINMEEFEQLKEEINELNIDTIQDENKTIQQINYELTLLKEKEKKLQSEIKIIDERISKSLSLLNKKFTNTAVATNDRDPSKRNKGVSEDPPSDDDDKSDDFDCEELKKNINKLCAYYNDIKDTNEKMKNQIKDVFKSVNDLTKSTNKLHNPDKILTDEQLTTMSEDDIKTLNKDKLPDTISYFHNLIDNEKDQTKKTRLIEKFSALSNDIKLYYNRK